MSEGPTRRVMPAPLKFALEMAPLALFFAVNAAAGIYAATLAIVVATAVSVGVLWAALRRVPVLPLASGLLLVVFGGLTLWLRDETFLKMKPTIVNALLGVALLGGLVFDRPLLAHAFDGALRMTARGWRLLSLRWGLFFLALAALNEVVWRTQDLETWVRFKVFGLLPLTLAFALAQAPLMQRHGLPEGD